MHPNAGHLTKFYAALRGRTPTPWPAATPTMWHLTTRPSHCAARRRPWACGACCATPRAKGMDAWAGVQRHRGRCHRRPRPLGRALPLQRHRRLVLNRIDGAFTFNPRGLIVTHRDRFDFWAWSRQALGTPGCCCWLDAAAAQQGAPRRPPTCRNYPGWRAMMGWFDGFEEKALQWLRAFARLRQPQQAGAAAAYGFPQTHVLWHRVAQRLKDDFFW